MGGRGWNGVETGFPHVIQASLGLALLDQVGHEFTELCLRLPPSAEIKDMGHCTQMETVFWRCLSLGSARTAQRRSGPGLRIAWLNEDQLSSSLRLYGRIIDF